jgi:hypothetical protein
MIKFLCFALLIFCLSCGSSRSNYTTTSSTNSITTSSTPTVSEIETAENGLDLQALGALAKSAKNAEDLERLLNQPDSINNLDLDEDGNVDYISVTQFKDETNIAKGYSLTVDLGGGNVQEIATILLERDSATDKTIDVTVVGNEEIYGTDDYYSGTWDYADSSFSSWSYAAHPYYVSPYRYGVYPSYYSRYKTVRVGDYRSRLKTYKENSLFKKIASVVTKTKLTSPNFGKSAANIKAPLSKPTTAQTSFQKVFPSKTKPSTTSSSTYSSSKSSSSSSNKPYSSSSSKSSSTFRSSKRR